MHTFRILHLSDLHLAKRPNEIGFLDLLIKGLPADCISAWLSSHHPGKLTGLSVFVHYNARNLDAILITGDIATSGKLEDLSRALQFVDSRPIGPAWFSSPAEELSANLQRGDIPIRLMPGNHDRFQNGLHCLPGNKAFDTIFEKYWKVRQGVQTQIILRSKSGNDQLAVISADCTLVSAWDATAPFGHFAQGKAYSSIIEKLKRETEFVTQLPEPTAVIWALHFPPGPPRKNILHNLINDYDLLREAESSAIGAILCGHLHEIMQYRHANHPGVWVSVADSACQVGNTANVLSLYEIDVDNGCIVDDPRTEIYQWDGESFAQV